MPKIYSYTICLYGRDYLQYALRSISPLVDRSYIFYTSHPSHGHSSEIMPPESRDELMASIPADEWDKITWIDTEKFYYEGPQRDYAVSKLIQDGADIILPIDYDEVWESSVLEKVVKEVWDRNISRNWLCNMYHLWKSFSWACEDDGWPVRVIDTRRTIGNSYISPTEFGKIFHFGYAITDKIMSYKISIHGHKDEWRPDWYETKWKQWPPIDDCHPTNGRKSNGEGWWNPKPFDKNLLPKVMGSHKWWAVEPIE